MRYSATTLTTLVLVLSLASIVQAQPTIFWTDSYAGKIQSMNLADGTTTDILTATLRFPQDIVVDLDGGKMYWISRGTDFGTIRRANLEGSEIEDLAGTEIESAQALALDPTAGWLYWSGEGTLMRTRLDGSAQEVLLADVDQILHAGTDAHGLALDLDEDKIYWTTAHRPYGRIYRANLDGSDVEPVLLTPGSPDDLALDLSRKKMYWTTDLPGGSGLMQANLDGSEMGFLFEVAYDSGGVHGPLALDADQGAIYLTGWDREAGGEREVERVYRYSLDSHEIEILPIPDDRQPVGFEAAGGDLYWTDPVHGSIHRLDLNSTESVELISSPLLDPQRMAVDPDDGKVYWTESSWIRRANLDGTQSENLVLLGPSVQRSFFFTGVTDFTLDHKNRKMYWTTRGSWGPDHWGGAYRANLDGSEIEDLYFRGSFAVALDPDGGKMYVADGFNEGDYKIKQANLDGSSAIDWIDRPADALAFDPGTGALYYHTEGTIRGGSSPPYAELVSGITGLESLTLDLNAEKMYWTEVDRDRDDASLTQSRIRRATLDGSNVEDLVIANGSFFGDIVVNASPSEVTAVTHEQPADFNLGTAYPNPFNPATTIRYTLGSTEQISIKVRDALGRIVAVLVDDIRPAGPSQVTWTAGSDTPSGVYFYTLETGSGARTRSMTLLK